MSFHKISLDSAIPHFILEGIKFGKDEYTQILHQPPYGPYRNSPGRKGSTTPSPKEASPVRGSGREGQAASVGTFSSCLKKYCAPRRSPPRKTNN